MSNGKLIRVTQETYDKLVANKKKFGISITEQVKKAVQKMNIKSWFCILVLLMATTVSADTCENPDTLPPKMKKAYYQLLEASKQIEGMKVEVKCVNKRNTKETYNDNQSRRTRNEQ